MTGTKETIAYAVSMLYKAAVLAAAWAGKGRKRETMNGINERHRIVDEAFPIDNRLTL